MTDNGEPQYRTYHQADAAAVQVRDTDDEDGLFAIRMPVVTTGEVRNEGDEPFAREELEGMVEQFNADEVTVFLDHGANQDVAASRYSAAEKAGVWRDADLETRDEDGEAQLVASAVLMDPETLPGETGGLREALSVIKAQAERNIPLAASVGWREDDAAPGGNDVLEASIVGIPADPRTTTQGSAIAMARDVLAESDLADEERERLVEQFRAAVMGSDAATEAMSETETEQSGDESEPDDTHDDEDGLTAAEFRERMLDLQEQQMDTLETVAEAVRAGDEDEEDDDEDADDEQDATDTETADADEAPAEDDTEEQAAEGTDELRAALETLRDGGVDVEDLDVPVPDDEHSAADEDSDDDAADRPSFSFSNPEET